MNTLFENQLDLFSNKHRAKVTDWIYERTDKIIQEHAWYYISSYQLKIPDRKDITGLDVHSGLHYERMYPDSVSLHIRLYATGDHSRDLTNMFNATKTIDSNKMKKDFQSLSEELEWNDELDLPKDLIDHIIKVGRDAIIKTVDENNEDNI